MLLAVRVQVEHTMPAPVRTGEEGGLGLGLVNGRHYCLCPPTVSPCAARLLCRGCRGLGHGSGSCSHSGQGSWREKRGPIRGMASEDLSYNCWGPCTFAEPLTSYTWWLLWCKTPFLVPISHACPLFPDRKGVSSAGCK